MLRTSILIACTIIIFLPTGIVAADQAQLFDKLDIDKNGTISREEFTSCPLVRGKDGRIQHQELCANPGAALSIEEKSRLYDKIDVQRSGAITRNKLNKFATPDGFAPIRF